MTSFHEAKKFISYVDFICYLFIDINHINKVKNKLGYISNVKM